MRLLVGALLVLAACVQAQTTSTSQPTEDHGSASAEVRSLAVEQRNATVTWSLEDIQCAPGRTTSAAAFYKWPAEPFYEPPAGSNWTAWFPEAGPHTAVLAPLLPGTRYGVSVLVQDCGMGGGSLTAPLCFQTKPLPQPCGDESTALPGPSSARRSPPLSPPSLGIALGLAAFWLRRSDRPARR